MFHVLGSTAVGQHIAAIAAPSMKKLSLELGGKNAAVVFHDANLEEAVDGLTRLDTLYEHVAMYRTTKIRVVHPSNI